MKVLHLHEHVGWSGGIETYLLSLVPLLEKQGVETVIGHSSGHTAAAARTRRLALLSRAGSRVERACYQEVARVLREERPDLVHVHNLHNTGAIAACLDTLPTVLTAHDYRYICPTSSLYYRRTRQVCNRTCGLCCFTTTLRHHCLTPRPLYAIRYYRRVRWTLANAHRFRRIIAPSSYVAGRFVGSGFPAERVEVLPYFCPFEPIERPLPPPKPPTVLFVGRIRPSKGFECFVRALGLLPEAVHGLMVGDFTPETSRQVIRLAQASGCGGRLQLQGWTSRQAIRDVYARATVLAFPSLWPETLGIVGLEALACGVPVVASDVGGVREWLHDRTTGLLVRPDDAAALATAVQSLIDCETFRGALARGGIELVSRKFGPASHVARLREIYELAVTARDNAVAALPAVARV